MRILKIFIAVLIILISLFIIIYFVGRLGMSYKEDPELYHLVIYDLNNDEILGDWQGYELYIREVDDDFIDFYRYRDDGRLDYLHLRKDHIKYELTKIEDSEK